MGLNEHFLSLMIGLKEQGYLKGTRVMELGAQQLSDAFLKDRADQERLAALFGKTPDQLPDLPRSMAGKLPGEEPHSRTFYEALGYKYDCVDIDGQPSHCSSISTMTTYRRKTAANTISSPISVRPSMSSISSTRSRSSMT